jgi:hypothetical protein
VLRLATDVLSLQCQLCLDLAQLEPRPRKPRWLVNIHARFNLRWVTGDTRTCTLYRSAYVRAGSPGSEDIVATVHTLSTYKSTAWDLDLVK